MNLVPSPRLLWLVFYAALVAVGTGPFPQLMPGWLLGCGVILLAALADAAGSLVRARPPAVSAPPLVRFLKDRAGLIPLGFHNPARRALRMRVGVGLPAAFASANEERWIDLPTGAEHARAEWPATPRSRGRYQEVVAAVEVGSFAGLWRLRHRTRLRVELRVHANVLAERKQIAALFLARGQPGVRLQRTLGRGREFEKLRDYLPGDGFDEIHWKATAKRGRPVTKVFQAERTQEIYVVIDASRLSARPLVHAGIEQTVLERYVASALVLLAAAGRQGDKFGIAAYDDRVRVCVRAGAGGGHYAGCRDALLELKPAEATPDLPEIVRHLRAALRRRALLFFLTDLSDPVLAEDFTRHVAVLAKQHLVVVGQLPPPQVAPLFSGEPVGSAPEIYGRLAGHARWAEARVLAQQLKPLGVGTVTLTNETMAAQLVTEYLRIKARQAL